MMKKITETKILNSDELISSFLDGGIVLVAESPEEKPEPYSEEEIYEYLINNSVISVEDFRERYFESHSHKLKSEDLNYIFKKLYDLLVMGDTSLYIELDESESFILLEDKKLGPFLRNTTIPYLKYLGYDISISARRNYKYLKINTF